MANITVPIQVNLPDDWMEQIVNRLRNDPESEWVEIIRCKVCKYYRQLDDQDDLCVYTMTSVEADDYCSYAERKEGADG